ncbi:hypothetical protein ACS0TY_014548 [Phlomoides rotata]
MFPYQILHSHSWRRGRLLVQNKNLIFFSKTFPGIKIPYPLTFTSIFVYNLSILFHKHKTHLGIDPFAALPEDFVSEIWSRTSPLDASRFAVVSKDFKSAVESDAVWDRFLPVDFSEILSRSVSPVIHATKKDLYSTLSHSPILLDAGKLVCVLIPSAPAPPSFPHFCRWRGRLPPLGNDEFRDRFVYSCSIVELMSTWYN